MKEIDARKNNRQLEKEENEDIELSKPKEMDTKINDLFQKVGDENTGNIKVKETRTNKSNNEAQKVGEESTENIKAKETGANSNNTSKLKSPPNENFVKVEKKKEKAKTKDEIFKETKEKGNGFVQKVFIGQIFK